MLDYANNLYIADHVLHEIRKYLFDTLTGITIAGNITNSSSLSNLANPSHIIMDENEDFYIADKANNRVLFWPKNSTSGTIVAGTGIPGTANNQLDYPYDIARHPTSGTLLIIANHGAHNVVRYTLGSNAWTLVAGNISGGAGNTSTTLNNPIDAIVDPMGNMYVADRANCRIQFFRPGELVGSTIAGITGVSGNDPTELSMISSVALDGQLNLYVSDSLNGRIQKFSRY